MKTRKRLIKNCEYTWEVVEILERCIRRMPEYKDCEIKTYGPHGLAAECSIFVKRNEKIIGDLIVIYGGENKFQRRTYENLHIYPKNSIADLNGYNYKTYDLPLDNDECIRLVFATTEGSNK